MPPSTFKFLDSYGKDDASIFFGRDKEVAEIYQRCSFGNTLVVYGRSGTGKTSLLQCGLSNAFDEQDWLPVFVRRRSDLSSDWLDAIHKQVSTPFETAKGIVHEVRNLYLDHFKPLYFIFDQFEELFIFGDEQEVTAFFEKVKALLNSDLQVQLIFVIREEYLAHLSSAEQHVEGLLDNRIRIEHMSVARVKGVLAQMCEAAGIEVGDGFIEELSSRMATSTGVIELSYLQVYLDALRRKYPNTDRFTVEMITSLGNFGDVLDTFLQRQLDALEEPAKGEAVLKAFVSAQGTKRLVDLSELQQLSAELGTLLDEAELQALVNRFVDGRILRQLGEEQKYELRHDTLAAVIYQRITLAEKELLEAKQFVQNAYSRFRKNGTGLRKEDLDYLGPYAKRLYLSKEQSAFLKVAFEEKERRSKRKLRLTQAGVGVLLILLIAASTLLYRNYRAQQLAATLAESEHLAALSRSEDIGDPMLAFLLAERAHQLVPGAHSHRALLEAYNRGPGMVQQLPTNHFIHISDTSFIIIDQANKKQYHINLPNRKFIETSIDEFSSDGALRIFSGASELGFWHFDGGNGPILFTTWEGKNLKTGIEAASSSFLPLQHTHYDNLAVMDGNIILVRKDSLQLQRIESSHGISKLLKQVGDSVICKTDQGLEVFSLSSHGLLPFFSVPNDSTFTKAYLHFEDSLILVPFNKGFHIIDLNGSSITLEERHFKDGSFKSIPKNGSAQILYSDTLLLIIQFRTPFSDFFSKNGTTYFFSLSGKEPRLVADSKERFVSKIGENCFAMYDNVSKTFRAPLPLNEYHKTQTSSTRNSRMPSSCMDGVIDITDVEYVGRANNGLFFFRKGPPHTIFGTVKNQLLLITDEGHMVWSYTLPHDINSAEDLIHTSGHANTEAVVLKKISGNEIIVFDKLGAVLIRKTLPKKLLLNQNVHRERLLSLGTKGYLFHEVGTSYLCEFPNGSIQSLMGSVQYTLQEGTKSEFNKSKQIIFLEQKQEGGMAYELSEEGKVIPLFHTPFIAAGKVRGWVDERTIAFIDMDPTRPFGKNCDVSFYEISLKKEISLKAEVIDMPSRINILHNAPCLAYAFLTEDLRPQITSMLSRGKFFGGDTMPAISKLLLINRYFEVDTIPIFIGKKSTLFHQFVHLDSCLFLCKDDTLLTINMDTKTSVATAVHGLSPHHRVWSYKESTPLYKLWRENDNAWMQVIQQDGNTLDTLFGDYTTVYQGRNHLFKNSQSMPYSYSSASNFWSFNKIGIIHSNVDLLELSSSGTYLRERVIALPEGFQLDNFVSYDIALLNSADKLALAFVEGDLCTIILEMDKLSDANNAVHVVHEKFILTNHRLLNRYELFPINGDVAIEMVREQGRLGEVREFTDEERKKYGLK